jgi:hypothetical protein
MPPEDSLIEQARLYRGAGGMPVEACILVVEDMINTIEVLKWNCK